jgi:hypothetical protein
MSDRKLVLLYNHADPDESFVSMLTDEEIAQAKSEDGDFDAALYDTARANQVKVPTICYYA